MGVSMMFSRIDPVKAICAVFLFAFSAAVADERIVNGSFAAGSSGWSIYRGHVDAAVSRDRPGGSLRLEFADGMKGQAIAHQKVALNQEEAAPFAYSVWTKCEGLPQEAVPSHDNFGIELCVNYRDGRSQWISTKRAPGVGTHGWERLAGHFVPPRAVKEVIFYARLRLAGKAWFDEFSLDSFLPPRNDLPGCTIREETGTFVLENGYMRLVFEPAKGGTCREFTVKATGINYAGDLHPNARLFTDRLRVGGKSYDRVYHAEVLRNTPEEAALRLSLTAPDGYPFLELSKTFRITSRSAALECTYSYRNLPESMSAQVFEPYFRNGMAAFKRPGQRYLVPTANGVRRIGPTGGNMPLTNAVAGWVAAADGAGGTLVCEFDYSRLASEYFWLGGVDDTTAEWTFQPVEVAAGGRFETTLTLYPATGMKCPDGAENGICASFPVGDDGSVSVELMAAKRYLVEAEIELVKTDGSTQRVSRTVQLVPDAAVRLPLDAKAKDLKVARAVAKESGRAVFETEHPFASDIIVKPRKAKAKPAELKPFELKLSEELVTPHTAWMKPYAGGRLKVFFLVDLRHAREVVELAQRLELDHRVIRIADHRDIMAWGMCDRYGRFTYEDANLSLKQELSRPLDAIVIAGNLWRHVDAANRTTIARLAASGVGIVEIGMKQPIVPDAAPDTAGTRYIKSAIDDVLLPYGANRIAAFSGGRMRAARIDRPADGGLTPVIPYDKPEPPFRYQDYSLGILARAVAWAANRVVPVPSDARKCVETVDVPGGGMKIVHTFFRDGEGRVCDWSAKAEGQPATGAASARKVARLFPEDGTYRMPFAVGESFYRSAPRRYLNPLRFSQYKAIGVNELRYWHSEDRSPFFDEARQMGFRMNFPLTGTHLWKFTEEFSEPYAKTKDKRYLCRKPCFNDPDYIAADRARIEKGIEGRKRYAPTSFDCGDENSLTLWGTSFDFCFSKLTLAAERKWLRETYGSLEKLNASWKTAFASWDEVTPLTTDEALAAHSKDRQWAAWADHRRFMELTYCGYFRSVKAAIDAKCPGVPLDMSGTQPPNGYTGMDMWLLSDAIGVCAAYDQENLAEIVRSFRRPLIKPWYGYGASGPDVERRVWFDALRFRNFGVSYFDGMNVLNPDFTVPDQVKELSSALRFFIDGGAALLKTLDERPQALIHYSQASIHAAQIEKRYDSFLASRAVWCKLLDDMNISYRFVAYGEIESGELRKTTARVLILPESSALSEKEAAEMRAFAANGGCVVGDRFSATHDIHCNLLASGALDDLFVARKGAVRIDRVLPQYNTLRMTERTVAEAVAYRDSIAAKFSRFLPDVGVRYRSKGITGVRTFTLFPVDGGGKTYLGFVREGESNGSDGITEVAWPGRRNVRDLRTGRDLGLRSGMTVTLEPYQAAFYELSR